MTTDTRIPCPTIEETLHHLVELALESPDHRSEQAYLDELGYPEDLVGHALSRMDAPINIAAAGHFDHHVIAKAKAGIPGTPRRTGRFPLLWNRLFTSVDLGGTPTPYDHRFTMFWGMRDSVVVAEDYLVYALLDHIVSPQGRGRHADLAWRDSLVRGIKSFRRFMNSAHSGFLVQVSQYDSKTQTILPPSLRHEELRQNVDLLTSKALEDLTNKKDNA
ncbi:hypothetical protein SEA_CLAYDA5_23 [Microbacterium phage Clayda5]|nr:hypothetical protein SEA_CLAYDA5_23 [Microbacterium phage Clayda5]